MTKSMQGSLFIILAYVVVDMLKDPKEHKKRRMNMRGYEGLLYIFLEKIVKVEDAVKGELMIE